MSYRRRAYHLSTRELIELGPVVEERMALRSAPDAGVVASYVLTRCAARAWEAINLQERSREGAIFWTGGPCGAGKTHFLNYALALARKSGPPSGERGRHLTLAIQFEGAPRTDDVESRLAEAIAAEIGGRRDAIPWREMQRDALGIALSEAGRHGFGSITIGMDFGEAPLDQEGDYFRSLAKLCRRRTPRLIAIAAGRGGPPAGAMAFEVGPSDRKEEMAVAIGRARRLRQNDPEPIEQFYGDDSPIAFDPRTIFPFDDNSAETLREIANPCVTVSELARLARDVLAPRGDGRVAAYRRPIAVADLLNSAAVRERVERKLGDGGRIALRTACEAADQFDGRDRKLASEIVRTLALAHFNGGSPRLKLADLAALLPARFERRSDRIDEMQSIDAVTRALAEKSSGVIEFEDGVAYFNVCDRGAANVAAFNAALPILRKFDPSITLAEEIPELNAKLKRVRDAMANAVEEAERTRQAIAPVLAEAGARLSRESNSAIPDYTAIAAGGPEALIEAAAHAEFRGRAMKTIEAYEAMAAAASAAPRLHAMREYLCATGLEMTYEDASSRDSRIGDLETQCQLLGSQLNPSALLGGQRNIDALQARFQQFRWSYVEEYRIAHQRWRVEMNKLAEASVDARRHLDALRRLNAIAALGRPEGESLEPALEAVEKKIVPCDFEGSLSPEMDPRCPRCGFILGTPSPSEELAEVFRRIRAALGHRLEALSKAAVARLIRKHDSSHRLDGFLKIIQAAQTDALVPVLDDELACYLARLIDENPRGGRAPSVSDAYDTRKERVVRNIAEERSKAGESKVGS